MESRSRLGRGSCPYVSGASGLCRSRDRRGRTGGRGGEALKPTGLATSITPAHDGKPAVFTDGPFAETKEVISGFYLMSVDSPQQAGEIAALCPTGGCVELYPVMQMADM